MEWKIVWRDGDSPYTVKQKTLSSRDLALKEVEALLDQHARDISLAQVRAPIDLGGVPYDVIAEAFRSRNVVPFLGAGVPLCGRPPGALWEYSDSESDFPDFLPSGAELAAFIARVADLRPWSLRDTENLARVASYYTISNPKTVLAQRLQRIFAKGKPTEVHNFLARKALHPMVIVTTNYDTLMEDALEAEGQRFDTIIHCTDIAQEGRVLFRKYQQPDAFVAPRDVDINPSERTVLYKMHGSIDRSPKSISLSTGQSKNYVITEEDYVKFLSRLNAAAPVIPSKLMDHFRERSFLFLGYSLEDWNVRVILDSLTNVMQGVPAPPGSPAAQVRPGDPPPMKPNLVAQFLSIPPPQAASKDGNPQTARTHWAIQLHPTFYDIEVWKGRHVVVRDSDLNVFVKVLSSPLFQLA